MPTAFDIKSTVSYTIVGFRRLKSEVKRKCFKSHQLTPKLHKLSRRELPPALVYIHSPILYTL